jgi:hypothetical protein
MLQKQSISLAFQEGLDTKTDPKQVLFGKLLTLENGIFVSPKKITKRNGYASIGTVTAGKALASYQDELLAFDGNNIQSLSLSQMAFQAKGQAVSVETTAKPVISNGYSQNTQDSAYHSLGFECYVWEDSRGGGRYSVKDHSTGQLIVADAVLAANAQRTKVFALGNRFLFTYYNGTNLQYKVCSVAALSTLSAATDIATDVKSANPNYDAARIGARVYFAYASSTGTNSITVKFIDSNLSVSADFNKATEVASSCITVLGDGNSNVWVGYHNGTKVKSFVVSYALVSVMAVTDVETVGNIRNITGVCYETSSSVASKVVFIYEVTATNDYDHNLRQNTMSLSSGTGTAGTAAVFIRSVGLATKAFTYNSQFYVTGVYGSSLQPTYFLLSVFSGSSIVSNIVAKIASQVSGGHTTRALLPEVNAIDNTFLCALLQKQQLDVQSGVIFATANVIGVTLDFSSTNTFLRATLAKNLHVTGGFLSMYDGVSVTEHGFHVYPEQAATPTTATTGGGIGAGTFQYCFIYEWTDNQGNIHRSAPSVPQTVVTTAGTGVTPTVTTATGSTTLTAVSSLTGLVVGQHITGTGIPANTYIQSIGAVNTLVMTNAATANGSVTMTTTDTNKVTWLIPSLRLTGKRQTQSRSDVVLVTYRTQTASTIFYRVTSVASPTINDPTADTVSFADTVPDFYLNGNELLYTTGGVIENIPPPACSLIANYKNRIVVVPSENRLSYWISKEYVPGSPVEFSDLFVKAIDAFGGDVTAVAQMDEKLILWKGSCIYVTTGEGPNDTGTTDDLGRPQLVNTDSGCINARSVARIPNGLMYQSGKGMYLLDRSLSASYIGAPVEAYNDLTITSAVLVPNTNQVRFTTAEGTCLVYDYFFNQWSVFTNHLAADATTFQDLFCYITPGGVTYQETPGTFVDGSAFIKLKLVTSWLSFAGLQGFQRVWQLLLLGEYLSNHRLIVTAAYDFNPTPLQQTYIDAGTLLDNTTYGEDTPYGAGTPYGGNFPLYQFRVFMTRQKCEAIQIGIEEAQTDNYGEGLSLSALNFLVGMKSQTYKVNPSRSFA